MATVVKDFKIKSGLIVEGTTGKINNFDILTKSTSDQNYIIGLIGGSATSEATPDTVVLRDETGSFAAYDVTAEGGFFGNLSGDVTGTVSDISNHDTSDLAEGSNLYFTDTRAKDAVASALGDGIEYESGSFNVQIANGLVLGGGTGNEIEIDRAEVDTWYDSNGSANQALTDANSYTNVREAAITTAYQTYANEAELDAVATANSYTDGRELAITTAYETYADQAETDANAYTDSEIADLSQESNDYVNLLIGDVTVDGSAGNTVTARISTAIADLVDSAPATLDTLNELAAALQDNPDIISDLQDIAAGKQDTLTAGANIDITGDTISVTGLDTDDVSEGTNLYFTDARAVTANTGLWDTIGAANTAQGNAEQFATDAINALDTGDIEEGTNLYFTNARALTATASAYDSQGSAQTAEDNAKAYADGVVGNLNTDDIEEGATNLYFTDSRAKASAMALLVDADTTNVTIEYNVAATGLVITAENGVADSTTDDLVEGENNLYFTDERAFDAIQETNPNFTSVEISSVAKQVASQLTAATAGVQVGHVFAKADYRSAEFLVKVAYGSHTEISKVLLTLDTSDNIAITEYGIVGTNGSASSISADVSGDDVRLLVTTANNNSTVTVMGTLLV